jgi:HlyD family secretion protein
MIKNMLSKIFSFLKRRWLLSSIVAVVLIVIVFSLGKGGTVLQTVKVEKGTVTSEVSVTGTVKPTQSLDLGFVQGGRIAGISVKVGDKISSGQILANLDNGDLSAQLAEAQANIQVQQAKLDQLVRGSRPESLKITESQLEKAKIDLVSDYMGVVNILNDAYAKNEDAVKNQVSSFFVDDNADLPRLSFSLSDPQKNVDSGWQRILVGKELANWSLEIQSLTTNSASSTLEQAMTNAQTHIDAVRVLLNDLSDALQDSIGLSPTALDSYKTNLNTARANVNAVATNIANQQQTIASQKALIQNSQDQYDLLLAGSDPGDISAAQAQLAQTQASAQYAQAQYNKTVLRAPFSGTVTRVVPSVGDIVTANDPVVSIVGSGKYQIEASIAESDISRVQIGKTAAVTLDAYGPDVNFSADVISVDLSATNVDGVATYKTVLQFNQEDSRILAGLTANVDILSDKKDGVLYVPTRDIIQQTDGNYLRVMANTSDKNPKLTKIETGLVGSDGRTEIVSGVNEGALILAE